MSKKENQVNFQLAKEYIELVRGDMSVDWRTVMEQLEELEEMCASTIEAMREEHKKR